MDRRTKRQDNRIDVTDILFLPSAAILSYVLARWLWLPFAISASVLVNLLVFALFGTQVPNLKKFILAILAGGAVTCAVALVYWWLS